MASCCTPCESGGTCLGKSKDVIPGGLADKKRPEDFDAEKLKEGVKVELEHTSSRSIAEEIAMDHLMEDSNYYEKLKEVEKNYRPVRKLKFQGMDVSIEHDKGMVRFWTDDATGEQGKTKMSYPYGYIRRTMGADDEQVDCYIGPEEDSEKVYIIHQMKKPSFKRYDEDKVMLGFGSAREAKNAYLMHFNDPRFFGTMTHTTVKDFKRIFVKKSFAGEYEELRRSVDDDLAKGIKDKLSDLWTKLKRRFRGQPEKPTKTWVRNSAENCRTGVCERLHGTTVAVDDTFEAMKGMAVMGPPAHLSCKCTLEFSTAKSMENGLPQMGMQMGPTAPMPLMQDPHDCETYEGCDRLLGTLGGVKDDELMQIAEKIWGTGYTYEGQDPLKARTEIRGWLLDQKDLLQFAPPEAQPLNEMNGLDPLQGSPESEPPKSSESSPGSEERVPELEGNSYGEESNLKPSQPSSEQDFSQKKKDQDSQEDTQ